MDHEVYKKEPFESDIILNIHFVSSQIPHKKRS